MSLHTTPDSYTKLLIHSDTSDASTTFVDSSPSGHTITATNANHTSSLAKFGDTSMHFDGTGDYLSVADHADWEFNSGDYTIDLWVKHTDHTGTEGYVWQYEGGGNANYMQFFHQENSGLRFFMDQSSGGYSVDTGHGGAIKDTNWHHIAMVKYGSNYTIYKDGINVKSVTSTIATPAYSGALIIGDSYGSGDFDGYMDEIRISKGIARWTENFTPPNKPYSVVDDDFVTDVAGIEDESGVTTAGKDFVVKSDPGEESAHHSYTKLLISSNTSNGSTTFVDSSVSGHTITATNANHATTQAKFGDTSIYFDGTGDYISVASHADFTIGTGDYTIDAWVYMSDDGAERFFLSGDGTTQGYFHLSYRGDHSPKEWEIRWYDGSSAQVFTIDHDITINSWHHVAIVFSGGDTISLFYDGVLLEASSKAYNQPAEGIHVGSLHGYLTSTAGYNGYIDEIRYSKGVARWTSNFTPPTEPYAIRKTSLFSVNAKDGRTLFEIDAEGGGIFPAGHVINFEAKSAASTASEVISSATVYQDSNKGIVTYDVISQTSKVFVQWNCHMQVENDPVEFKMSGALRSDIDSYASNLTASVGGSQPLMVNYSSPQIYLWTQQIMPIIAFHDHNQPAGTTISYKVYFAGTGTHYSWDPWGNVVYENVTFIEVEQ
jgi:hypothetical protein